MNRRLEVRQWISLNHPAYAAILSSDGQYIGAGLEQGLAVFNVTGTQFLSYPPVDTPMPVHQLAATPDMGQLYVGTRQGWLICLDLEREEETFDFHAQTLYQADNDLHTIALSADGQSIAVGHLSPGLALLQTDGHLLWRQHPHDGTATESQIWAVALAADGHTLYVGSAGSGTNQLAALDARSGFPRAHCYLEAEVRATAVAALPEEKGVVAVLAEDPYTGRVVRYDHNLSDLIWECTFDEPVTALMADPQQSVLVIGVGYEGQIALMDAQTGQVLASDLTLKSAVNGLAIAQGRLLAAATQDGHLVLIRYLP